MKGNGAMKNIHLEKVAMKKQNALVRVMSAMMLLAITVFASSGLVRAKYEGQLGTDIDGEAVDDRSGHSVSLSTDGSIVAIGAPGNDGTGNGAGHVRVYQYASGAWVQLGADIDGEAWGDGSGNSVSLSTDGSIVAIGAYANDGTGDGAGHVRVYQYASGAWVQLGADIDGEAAGDESGRSVSLSADGSIVAIGAGGNDGTGSNSGHVRVYSTFATEDKETVYYFV